MVICFCCWYCTCELVTSLWWCDIIYFKHQLYWRSICDLQPVTVTRWAHWRGECVTVTPTWTWGWLQDSAAAKPTWKAHAAMTAERDTTAWARTTLWAASVRIYLLQMLKFSNISDPSIAHQPLSYCLCLCVCVFLHQLATATLVVS